MAERYGNELAEALPEVDLVAPFGASLTTQARGASDPVRRSPHAGALGSKPGPGPVPSFDLLQPPPPGASAPWAYVKVAEGCDRNCGFCAIPSFRGKQRSRSVGRSWPRWTNWAAAGTLSEVVLVAQDLSSFALDRSGGRDRAPTRRPGRRWQPAHRRPGGRRVRRGCAGPASSTSTRPPSTTPWWRPYWPPACPTSTSPSSTCPVPCSSACAAGARATGSSTGSLDPDGRAHRRLPLLVHRRLPGRDRGGPRPAPGLDRGGPVRLGRLLPLQQRGRHLRRRPRRPGARRSW